MVLNVSKFNLYFPNPALNIVQARSTCDLAVNADLSLSDLADMGAGISTDGMRVAGVLVAIDDWVKAFVVKKARIVFTNVAKLDVVTDGLIHLQMLNFCQNTRLAFLSRNTPTPLISEILAQVDDTIVEAVCRNGTSGGHVDWTPHLRKFANMKIQVPRFAIMILAFYSATCVLIAWLGSHGGALPAQQFADMWAPWHDFTPPKLGMHPFYKHFQNRMLYSSRTEGVSNGPLGLIAPAFLWQIVDQSLLRSQVLALAILPNCHLL